MSKRFSPYATFAFVIFMISQLFLFQNKAFESISESWERCIKSLLPSLFPMSVLSKQLCPFLIVQKSRFSSFLSKLSGFSERELPVFMISLFCGYPIPSMIAKSMADSGVLSKEEARAVIALCNNASPAFLIFFVGSCVLGSQTLGIILYICQTISVIILSHFRNTSHRSVSSLYFTKESLSDSIKGATQNTLLLFGFVIFFSLTGDMAQNAISHLGLPHLAGIMISGIFESTSAITEISQLPFCSKLVLICFFSSFGGLSVFFQIRTSAGKELVDTTGYFATRLAVFIGTTLFLVPLIFLAKSTLL